MRKTIDDLTISDDFIFSAVFGNPKNLPLVRKILSLILRQDCSDIREVIAQSWAKVTSETRAVRFDTEFRSQTKIIDLEMQNRADKHLGSRTFHYHATVDVKEIRKGMGVDEGRNVWAAVLCSFDPDVCLIPEDGVYTRLSGKDRRLTLSRKHATILIGLQTGQKDALAGLRSYFSQGIITDPLMQELDMAVREAKEDPETRRQIMTLVDVREQGINIGKEEGINIGKDIGRKEGINIGIDMGRMQSMAEIRRTFLAENKSCEETEAFLKKHLHATDEELAALAAEDSKE